MSMTPPHDFILVLNCGSSSIKFAIFDAGAQPLPYEPLWRGEVQGIGGPNPTFGETGVARHAVGLDEQHPHTAALGHILARVDARVADNRLVAVGHRVVHGGGQYFEPMVVDAQLVADLRRLTPLAPLHQPFPLKAMSLLLARQPAVLQVACFDTAFHRTLDPVEQMLPLTYSAWQRGIRRYGFHGLSYDYISGVLRSRYGERAADRVIVAHLGSGASLCAMRGLRSVATTMGFSALDGLMMGTRTGALDPGVLLYLLETEGLALADLTQLLYRESGLLGISGISADPRVIQQNEDAPGEQGERARLALALYVRRIVREIGALVAVLGGLDVLVFTAGIGENNAEVRARICRDLAGFGVCLDAAANARPDGMVSVADSKVLVAVEPTNEEWVVARAVAQQLAGQAQV